MEFSTLGITDGSNDTTPGILGLDDSIHDGIFEDKQIGLYVGVSIGIMEGSSLGSHELNDGYKLDLQLGLAVTLYEGIIDGRSGCKLYGKASPLSFPN